MPSKPNQTLCRRLTVRKKANSSGRSKTGRLKTGRLGEVAGVGRRPRGSRWGCRVPGVCFLGLPRPPCSSGCCHTGTHRECTAPHQGHTRGTPTHACCRHGAQCASHLVLAPCSGGFSHTGTPRECTAPHLGHAGGTGAGRHVERPAAGCAIHLALEHCTCACSPVRTPRRKGF